MQKILRNPLIQYTRNNIILSKKLLNRGYSISNVFLKSALQFELISNITFIAISIFSLSMTELVLIQYPLYLHTNAPHQ